MPNLNIVGRVILSGYEVRTKYVGDLKVTYNYHEHKIILEEGGQKQEFTTEPPPNRPWEFLHYIIDFPGERHKDRRTENGGRQPIPFVDFEITVGVPGDRIQAERAMEIAQEAASGAVPGILFEADSPKYVPPENIWDVSAYSSNTPQTVMKRVIIDAISGKVVSVSKIQYIDWVEDVEMEENDIVFLSGTELKIELILEDGKPLIVLKDDCESTKISPAREVTFQGYLMKIDEATKRSNGKQFIRFRMYGLPEAEPKKQ